MTKQSGTIRYVAFA